MKGRDKEKGKKKEKKNRRDERKEGKREGWRGRERREGRKDYHNCVKEASDCSATSKKDLVRLLGSPESRLPIIIAS